MTLSTEQTMHSNVSLHIALSPSEAVFAKALANICISTLHGRAIVGFFFPIFLCKPRQINHISHAN